eukprot:CAMPEP_0168389488 /NCGR_PEP_ID=MMETSP0228-20121227/16989_1 /TAXON_ID=133427 /ORGANISM="Protoceratium reticulatum, Strain CCCM 535 (=CCMP 1889)" /LENGTH=435 /DNA_ID=CAMNT_0008402761 /DNA_START=1 /DNA_END=1308 /DNA_ORIENTATION=-
MQQLREAASQGVKVGAGLARRLDGRRRAGLLALGLLLVFAASRRSMTRTAAGDAGPAPEVVVRSPPVESQGDLPEFAEQLQELWRASSEAAVAGARAAAETAHAATWGARMWLSQFGEETGVSAAAHGLAQKAVEAKRNMTIGARAHMGPAIHRAREGATDNWNEVRAIASVVATAMAAIARRCSGRVAGSALRATWLGAVPWVVAVSTAVFALHSLYKLGTLVGGAGVSANSPGTLQLPPAAAPMEAPTPGRAQTMEMIMALKAGMAIGGTSVFFALWLFKRRNGRGLCPVRAAAAATTARAKPAAQAVAAAAPAASLAEPAAPLAADRHSAGPEGGAGPSPIFMGAGPQATAKPADRKDSYEHLLHKLRACGSSESLPGAKAEETTGPSSPWSLFRSTGAAEATEAHEDRDQRKTSWSAAEGEGRQLRWSRRF